MILIFDDWGFFYITGIHRFFELVKDAEQEYEKDYRIEYERLRKAKTDAEKVLHAPLLTVW